MPRDVHRAGPGAPRGNLNRVKSGIRSRQVIEALRSGSVREWKQILEKMIKARERHHSAKT